MANFESQLSFPYNAVLQDDGTYDRLFDAADFANDRAVFLSNGVFVSPSDNFQVRAQNGNMTVTVGSASKPNTSFINGHSFTAIGQQDLAVPTAGVSFTRLDIIVIRLSNLADTRNCRLLYRAGTLTQNPQAPALIRNADEWEIQLAQITVAPNTTVLTQAAILDTRLNTNLCGIVAYLGTPVDTSTVFNQYKAYLDQQLTSWDAIKAQETADWNAQTAWQLQVFSDWLSGAQTDLVRAVQFDFDNLANLPGNTKVTVFNANGSITETLRKTADSKLAATRIYTFNTNGSITTASKVYQADGVTVQLSTVIQTVFNSDGSINETITLGA
jgi:hypothetical protein